MITHAKERENSAKFLALSQKVIPSEQAEYEESSTMPVEAYHNRPLTTSYGQRIMVNNHNSTVDQNSRCATRKQRFRPGRLQGGSLEKKPNFHNLPQNENYYGQAKFNSVDTFK